METVKIDNRGRITRSKRKMRHRKINHKSRELKRFTRKELKSTEKCHLHQQAGVFKGAYVMKASKSEPYVTLNEKELIRRGSVNPVYDSRCHPANTPH